MDTSLHENTLNTLKKISITYDKIDFIKAVTIEVAYELSIQRLSRKSLLRSIIKILKPLKNKCFHKAFSERVIFSAYVNRKDYEELILSAKDGILNSTYIKILNGFKRQFSIPKPYYFHVIRKVWNLNLSINARLSLSSILIDYISAYRSLRSAVENKNIPLSEIKYIPFNSSVGLENIITQYINNNKGKTYHLCHGLHFAPNYLFFSIDSFNKELIAAHTILSWGQSFVDNDQNHYAHEIVGNPKYPEKKIEIKINTNTAIVLLARGQYDDNNCKLIEVLAEYTNIRDTKFYIKPHPTCDINRIRELCNHYGLEFVSEGTINDLFKHSKFGFAISYESTAYFEAMYHNIICFRYAYEENECYGELDNRFMNAEQLDNQINKYLNKLQGDNSKINTIIHDTLRYEIGMGINRYREILQNN